MSAGFITSLPPNALALRLHDYAWLTGPLLFGVTALAALQGVLYAADSNYFSSGDIFLAADEMSRRLLESLGVGIGLAAILIILLEIAARLRIWWGTAQATCWAAAASLLLSRALYAEEWASILTMYGFDFPSILTEVEALLWLAAPAVVVAAAALVAGWMLRRKERCMAPQPFTATPWLLSVAAVVLVGGAFVWAAVEAPEIGERQPNIIWVTWDSVRADHLSLYGYDKPTTPNLEEFAERAVVFEQAVAQANWTRPSYVSMFVSRWPWFHRRIEPEHPALAEKLRSLGYRTLGVVQNPNLDAGFGFSQGFRSYVRFSGRTAPAEVTERAIAEIGSALEAEEPVFAFIHSLDPHYPYAEDNPFRAEFLSPNRRAVPLAETSFRMSEGRDWDDDDPEKDRLAGYFAEAYDAEIRRCDQEFRRLLDFLESRGAAEESLIIFNSDHGEEFADRGRFGHASSNLFPELTFVPLMVRFPRVLGVEARRVARMVENLDIYPTILRVLGEDGADELAGVSLYPPDQTPDPGSMAHAWEGRKIAIRNEAYAFIADFDSASMELYDRNQDPLETAPVASLQDERSLIELRTVAVDWYSAHRRSAVSEKGEERVPPALRRSLEGLGYIQ